MHRQLRQAMVTVLSIAGLFLLLALGLALLGLPHSVESFKSATWACGYGRPGRDLPSECGIRKLPPKLSRPEP